ncbi:inactive transglutaminase family protein [Kistimonas scapharcae]|uniref:Inactive transglutaminase family protein n=1 Tax=Kistimonas scapharcae TaxID=1036133 RepID=A0ABP8V8F5_9GAMM
MSNKMQMRLVVLILIAIGLGTAVYKHVSLGFPIFPGERTKVWEVEAQIEFKAEDGPVTVSLAMPEPHSRFSVVNDFFASPGYGFRKVEDGGIERAEWTRREASGKQVLYYKIKVHDNGRKNDVDVNESAPGHMVAEPPELYLPELEGASRVAAIGLLKDVKQHSSNDTSMASLLVQQLNQPDANPNVKILLDSVRHGESRAVLLMQLLRLMDKPVRLVRGVYLESGRRKQPLVEMVEVLTTKGWIMIDPESGHVGVPNNFLPWQRGGVSLLDVTGGYDSRVNFSVISRTVPVSDMAIREGKMEHAALVDFSLYSLPIEEQNAYRYILLVPIGTLIVVLMRILVGLKTSGTFMPVLMALAFLQTKLLPGLVIFLTIVSIGLWIRFILSRLNLLLVARISAVVIVVVGIMAGMSILSYKMGIRQAMSVTFFPMIILAWTIERMSILWEEQGPRDVLVSGGGSLLVAIISYFAMTNRFIEHLTFNFPELLLVVLGVTLLLGQYTGYRLLELRRFKPLIEN